MGINALTIAWLSELTKKEVIKPGSSIIDFGPQDVLSSRSAVELYARRHVGDAKTEFILNQMFDGENSRGIIPAHFYSIFGINRYRSTDLLDKRANWLRDLNLNTELPEKFDIATNFGTAEHVFNISAVFKSMHDVVHADGLMLHILPAFGDIDHGFYNIHPTLYLDISAANNYKIEFLSYVDRWDIRNKRLEADLLAGFDFDLLPIRMEHLRHRSTLQRMITNQFIQNYSHPDTAAFGAGYDSMYYDYCVVALRKTSGRMFRFPVQRYYGGTSSMSVPVPIISRVQTSARRPISTLRTIASKVVRRVLFPLLPESSREWLTQFVRRHGW